MITLVALIAIIGPFLADWNETHIFNPRWTPHAKFHNAQTMLLGVGLGVSALWFVWRRNGDRKSNLLAAVIFAALYYITQAGSITFPGTALFDPEFDPGSSIPGQLILDASIFQANPGNTAVAASIIASFRKSRRSIDLIPNSPDINGLFFTFQPRFNHSS